MTTFDGVTIPFSELSLSDVLPRGVAYQLWSYIEKGLTMYGRFADTIPHWLLAYWPAALLGANLSLIHI